MSPAMPMPRCPRCDRAMLPDDIQSKHQCVHGNPCVRHDKPDACYWCKTFKERQTPMFDGFEELQAKPFLKWAGGKRQLVPQLLKHVPAYTGRYFEPMVGGGALFFALGADRAVLGDTNTRLIRAYQGVRYDVEAVIETLGRYPVSKEFFLELRAKRVDGFETAVEVACWLIYLNKTAFNGLYRVNKSGGFNVPWGKYKNPTICDAKNLRAASLMLRRAEFVTGDFEYAVRGATKGDLVYFDPPYVPASKSSNFTSYTEDGFSIDDHVRLRDCAIRLKQDGVHVMITNRNTRVVRELYADFKLHRLQARGSVAANRESRGKRVDLLVT